jgi:hypothetical protein
MEWKDVIEWVEKLLPAELRVPFTTGVMVLAVLCLCTIFIENVEWTEVFRVWWTPLLAVAVCAYWAIVIVTVRKSIVWPFALSWLLAAVLVLVAVALAVFSYDRSRYRYESGFFLLRNWQPEKENGQGYFEWSLEPATDEALDKAIIVDLSLGDNCDLSRFEGPAPERESNAMHRPVITDNSTLEHPNTSWKIRGLHRGEEVKFRLFAKDKSGSADSICFTPGVHSY